MEERLSGKQVLMANLRLLAAERQTHEEKGQAMAAEAARMLAEPYLNSEGRILRLAHAACDFLDSEAIPRLTAAERVSFVCELLSAFAEGGKPILANELLPLREDIPERISYFRTVYTDEAYDGFAEGMRDPTVLYADAFFLSCEDVKNGDAGYCILPCENSDGPLPAMTALADRYELFRVGTYRAFHADGENATHFGLFAMAMPAVPESDMLHLRFSAVAEDEAELALHLAALSCLGLGVLRTEVLPPDEEGGLPFTELGALERKALVRVLTYLRIFAKQLLLRGLYKEIG